ncbi:MAG: hypothetical protein IT290_09820 [Deltaproteobacteria bacterium]|nr:hypothetical protein [Deltaproteobacteria bacterium]
MKQSEKVILGITLGFFAFFGVIAYLTDGQPVSGTINFLGGIEGNHASESRNAAINCRDKRNMKLPYCEERRARTEADWKSIVRYGADDTNAFKLGK